MTHRQRSIQENVVWGLKWGVSAAAFFTLWIAIVRLRSGPAPFDDMGLSFEDVALFYLCSGVIAGIVLGLLRPVASASRLGAALVGWILAILVYAGAYGLFDNEPPWQWRRLAWVLILLSSAAVGCIGGIVHWQRHASRYHVRR